MFETEGFTHVRIWYQAGNWCYTDGDDYWDCMRHRTPETMRDEALKAEMIRLFNQEAPAGMCIFEKLFILACKT